MDIDPSFSKLRHHSNFKPCQGNNTPSPTPQNPKRPNLSERMTGQRRQRISNVEQAAEEEQDYEGAAAAALNAIEQDIDPLDSDDLLNFLEEGSAYRSLSEGWRGEL